MVSKNNEYNVDDTSFSQALEFIQGSIKPYVEQKLNELLEKLKNYQPSLLDNPVELNDFMGELVLRPQAHLMSLYSEDNIPNDIIDIIQSFPKLKELIIANDQKLDPQLEKTLNDYILNCVNHVKVQWGRQYFLTQITEKITSISEEHITDPQQISEKLQNETLIDESNHSDKKLVQLVDVFHKVKTKENELVEKMNQNKHAMEELQKKPQTHNPKNFYKTGVVLFTITGTIAACTGNLVVAAICATIATSFALKLAFPDTPKATVAAVVTATKHKQQISDVEHVKANHENYAPSAVCD